MGLPRATALVFGLLLAAAAHAQPVFPSRPVTLVLPSAPGDPTDLIARVLQPKMSERLGQQFVVENRPVGSAVIASSAVAKAPADGHTLLLALSAHSINPIALKELPYDTFRDFAPVTLLARFALIVGASSSVKGSDQREFVAALHEPDVLQKLGAVGFEIVGSTPQELDRFVRREFEHWDRFVREYNVKFD